MAGTVATCTAGVRPPWQAAKAPSRADLALQSAGTPASLAKHVKGRSRVEAAATSEVAGRKFFIDTHGLKEEHYARTADRLTKLGAEVVTFLDDSVDCVVAASTETLSAPSTPTAPSSGLPRGISKRAQSLSSSSRSSSAGVHYNAIQYARSIKKQVFSARTLESILVVEEQRVQEAARSSKRTRPGAGLDSKINAEDGSLPKMPRHKVSVRFVETEFCKRGPGIPEWWHFPECDRHRYFRGNDDAHSTLLDVANDTRAGQTAPSASAPDKKENTGPKNALKLARGGCKGGYCALCKMKHDNAKKHADSKAHRQQVQKRMAEHDELITPAFKLDLHARHTSTET